MQTTGKTQVEIIQELIAIHTTRKEAAIKLSQQENIDTKDSPAQLSDEFIAQLMNELSNYGDAVMESVDRENEYQHTWKAVMDKIENLSPAEKTNNFQVLENKLKAFYHVIIDSYTELPASLLQILKKQLSKL